MPIKIWFAFMVGMTLVSLQTLAEDIHLECTVSGSFEENFITINGSNPEKKDIPPHRAYVSIFTTKKYTSIDIDNAYDSVGLSVSSRLPEKLQGIVSNLSDENSFHIANLVTKGDWHHDTEININRVFGSIVISDEYGSDRSGMTSITKANLSGNCNPVSNRKKF
jgi:hypothetical protein